MELQKYAIAKKAGYEERERKDLKIKVNGRSADYILPSFATGCGNQGISCAYCVAEGTLITTPLGLIPVEQIQDGDLIITYDNSLEQYVSTHIGQTVCREVEEVIELETAEGKIVVSLQHPFMTQRGWVKAQDLTLEDKLIHFEDI